MLPRLLPASIITTLILLFPAPVKAQGPRGKVIKPQNFTIDTRVYDACLIIVKFAEGSDVRFGEGGFSGKPAGDLQAINALIPTLKRVERVFSRSVEDLDRERRAILAKIPADLDPPADLNLYYRFVAKNPAQGIGLYRELNGFAGVEIAFPDHRYTGNDDPADIPPTTPDYTPRQGYQGPAPNGIDCRVARVIPGGRGEQLQILDIETGLILNHEDVPKAVAANVIGPNPYPRDHGLAVAGELVGDKNNYGITGGVYKAGYKFHSHQGKNWASSVSVATANSQAGDIIVLEVHLRINNKYSPMEGRQDVFDAVRIATLKGIHVIAAGGNGYANLDDPTYGRIFDRTFRDSGSIIVGATNGAALVKAGFSNYGSIIDANGWGANVTTTGYTDLFYPNNDPRQKYTVKFGGTSSATPIVTSAAAALLSAAKQQLGRVITVVELRTLLRKHGTDVPGAMIGKRPNLKKLFAAIGLPAGLELKDEIGLGETMILTLTGRIGDYFIMAAAGGPGRIKQTFGTILLDPATMFFAGLQGFNTKGKSRFSATIPNLPALLLLEAHWQAIRFDPALTKITLTNSIVTYLEK